MITLLALLLLAPEKPGKVEGVMRYPGVRPEPPPVWARPALSLELQGGVGLPVTDLPFSPRFGLQLAWAPPILAHQLHLALETTYTRPSIDEPRVATNLGVTVDELDTVALASFHFMPDGWRLGGFAGAGGGLCVMNATTNFADGAQRSAGEVRPALVAFGGVLVLAGSGSLELEVRGQRSPSQTAILRGSSVVPLSVTVGYRFSLVR